VVALTTHQAAKITGQSQLTQGRELLSEAIFEINLLFKLGSRKKPHHHHIWNVNRL
jgi:hypothetical protein